MNVLGRALTLAGLAVAALALGPRVSFAQGPPIVTDTPIMLGLEGRGVRTFAKFVRRDTPGEPTTATIMPIVVPYNLFSDKFQVGAIVPFVNVRESSGVGDVRLFAKRLLYQKDARARTFRVAAKAGIKLPTGDDGARPPLGTGSTDYFFTTVAGWIEGRVGIYGEGIFNLNTSNDRVDFGNSFGYNVAFGYRLTPAVYERYPSPQLNVFMELNGTTAQKSRFDGQRADDTGGTLIFLSPGVQFIGGRRWLIEGAVQIPVVDRTNPGTSWTASLGTRILIF